MAEDRRLKSNNIILPIVVGIVIMFAMACGTAIFLTVFLVKARSEPPALNVDHRYEGWIPEDGEAIPVVAGAPDAIEEDWPLPEGPLEELGIPTEELNQGRTP